MNTIKQAARTLLDALVFANADNPTEFRKLLRSNLGHQPALDSHTSRLGKTDRLQTATPIDIGMPRHA